MDVQGVDKVRAFLDAQGYEGSIRHTEETIFTVEDASVAVGVAPDKILKSLIFLVNREPTLVLMSGSNKVAPKKIALAAGVSKSKIRMAQPEYVLETFGYRVGGVPPVGYDTLLPALIDQDIARFSVVWAAAGSDHDFFPIAPDTLIAYTKGRMVDLKEDRVP